MGLLEVLDVVAAGREDADICSGVDQEVISGGVIADYEEVVLRTGRRGHQ